MSCEHIQYPVSCIAAKWADAVAEVAAKYAAYQMVLEERKYKEKIQLKEQHKKVLESQISKSKQLQAQKDLRTAQAKLKVKKQNRRSN